MIPSIFEGFFNFFPPGPARHGVFSYISKATAHPIIEKKNTKKLGINETHRNLTSSLKTYTMKRKILLLSAVCLGVVTAEAQVKAYAITGTQKGSSNWSEVRLVDAATGDEIKAIYQNTMEIDKLNARTGKPIAKKDATAVSNTNNNLNNNQNVTVIRQDGSNKTIIVTKSHNYTRQVVQSDAPFATTSAALAYDKKHDRLYYTPMGINELRYIDMKTKTTKIYYFEGEAFGALKGRGDVPNQVTRMVIGADGKGYALTNNADHLIQFETDRKPEVKDLGALIDDPANGKNTVHSSSNYGGDIIADAQGHLWLIGANRRVYQVDLKTLVATYKGHIQGLPAGFSTNGACVEKDGGTTVVVCSSTSTEGYYRFDLNTLKGEKISTGEKVYNASDLANGFIAFSKKKKKDKEEPKEEIKVQPQQPEVVPADEPAEVPATNTPATSTATPTTEKKGVDKAAVEGTISIYPNPVTTGVTKIAFKDHPAGRYQVQIMDISGKMLSTQSVTISNKMQVEQVRMPQYIAPGSYMVKIVNQENQVVSVNPIIVQ